MFGSSENPILVKKPLETLRCHREIHEDLVAMRHLPAVYGRGGNQATCVVLATAAGLRGQ